MRQAYKASRARERAAKRAKRVVQGAVSMRQAAAAGESGGEDEAGSLQALMAEQQAKLERSVEAARDGEESARAAAVARAVSLLPVPVTRLVVCGGGRHNPALMTAIEARSGIMTDQAESLGWRGDALEAECFAYLAARHMSGLAVSLPERTGVPVPMPAGRLASPACPASPV